MAQKVTCGSEIAILVLIWALVVGRAMGTISCAEAIGALTPCIPYLTDKLVGGPTVPCCGGVQTVNDRADSTDNRRELCVCFKSASGGIGVNPEKAKALPGQCHITTRVPIDPSIDCSTVPIECENDEE